jgi:hypothetical protein
MTLNTRCLSIVDQTQNGGNDLDGSSISSGGIQGSHFSKDKGIYDIFMDDCPSSRQILLDSI